MTEQQREDAIKYIESQLEDGYLDLGSHDQDELEVIKEAMSTLKIIDKWNIITSVTTFQRPYDHIWDMYLDEFEDA